MSNLFKIIRHNSEICSTSKYGRIIDSTDRIKILRYFSALFHCTCKYSGILGKIKSDAACDHSSSGDSTYGLDPKASVTKDFIHNPLLFLCIASLYYLFTIRKTTFQIFLRDVHKQLTYFRHISRRKRQISVIQANNQRKYNLFVHKNTAVYDDRV